MGKNTMMKRSIRLYCEQSGNDDWGAILDSLQGNVGIVFTKGELNDVKEEIGKYKVGAPARVGSIAPREVVVPAGSTGMDPSQTSFFQVELVIKPWLEYVLVITFKLSVLFPVSQSFMQ